MYDPHFFLETPRLIIFQFDPDLDQHCQFLVDLFNGPKFITNCGDKNIRTVKDASALLRSVTVKQYKEQGFGYYIVALKPDISTTSDNVKEVLRSNLTLVGNVGLTQRASLVNILDIGYSILPEFEGQGYATEAAQRLLEFAQNTLAKEKIIGMANDDNPTSHRVLQKLGMVYWGMLKIPEFDQAQCTYVIPGITEIPVAQSAKMETKEENKN